MHAPDCVCILYLQSYFILRLMYSMWDKLYKTLNVHDGAPLWASIVGECDIPFFKYTLWLVLLSALTSFLLGTLVGWKSTRQFSEITRTWEVFYYLPGGGGLTIYLNLCIVFFSCLADNYCVAGWHGGPTSHDWNWSQALGILMVSALHIMLDHEFCKNRHFLAPHILHPRAISVWSGYPLHKL